MELSGLRVPAALPSASRGKKFAPFYHRFRRQILIRSFRFSVKSEFEGNVGNIGEEATSSSSSVYNSPSILSLSEKPDRNLAMLDEYEMEELDAPDDTHRSGNAAFFLQDI